MRAVDGEWRGLPGSVHEAVLEVVRRLHRQVAGDDVILLALTELDDRPPARLALEAEGVTAERLWPELRVGGDDLPSTATGFTFSPAYYVMHGRAQGLAAALGDGTITPEHVLVALVWDAGTAASQLLWRLGVSREGLVERLRELGVPVPTSPLPAQRETDWGEQVWFDRDQVRTVLDHIRGHVPPAARWGFNYDGDRAWLAGDASVDFEELVREALPPEVEARRIDHVQLAMPAGKDAEDEAEAFYAGLLGLARVPKPRQLAPQGCWFEHGEVRVHLGVDHGFRPARKAHPALLYRGLGALVGRLRDAGVPVVDGQPLEGERRVYVDDPFGNRVELVERGGTLPGPP